MDKLDLTNAIYNMDSAYQKFFKEYSGYPKFKSKHDIDINAAKNILAEQLRQIA